MLTFGQSQTSRPVIRSYVVGKLYSGYAIIWPGDIHKEQFFMPHTRCRKSCTMHDDSLIHGFGDVGGKKIFFFASPEKERITVCGARFSAPYAVHKEFHYPQNAIQS